MPTFGGAAQRAVKKARVLVIGAGGLGSPAALYLALTGIGTIGIVDGDTVALSNLQRQILYTEQDIGESKTKTTVRELRRRNSDLNLIAHDEMLGERNAARIVADYDIVVNGADNFPTRYLVNDTCHKLNKPLVDGAALRFDGQITTYLKGKGCYRCLFPKRNDDLRAPNCNEAGVLGAVTGVIGSLQAVETVKLVTAIGDNLGGTLLLFNAVGMEFTAVKYAVNPGCPLCGV